MSGVSPACDVIILAGGKGTRLKSDKPKVLHDLFGMPLLGWVLQSLNSLAVKTCYVIVGHEAAAVEAYLETVDSAFPIVPVIQSEQRGTGDAVRRVLEAGYEPEGSVLLLSGDVPLVKSETLTGLVAQHSEVKSDLTVVAADLERPFGYGRVVLNDLRQPRAIVEEKDATASEKRISLVNAGVYCFNWPAIAPLLSQLSSRNAQGELYFTDVVHMAQNAQLTTGVVELADENEMLGINNRRQLTEAHQIKRQEILESLMDSGVTILDPATTWIDPQVVIRPDTTIYPGCVLKGDVQVGSHSIIGPNTVLQGRVMIGDRCEVIQSRITDSQVGNDCFIGPFAHLRQGCLLDDKVHIGNFVELKNTHIASGSFASHLAYIGDAEVGERVNFGAGSITANFDSVRNLKYKTIIGDDVKVGSNCVLVAPVELGHDASIAAGSVITKNVKPNALGLARARQTQKEDWVIQAKARAAAEAQATSPTSEAKVPSLKQ